MSRWRLRGSPVGPDDRIREQLGALHASLLRVHAPTTLEQAELRVFSQFGEDGIIQFLIDNVQIDNEVFVEFGVQDYRESNTRFLLVHNNWRGLVMDSGTDHIEWLKRSDLLWRHTIDAVSITVTRENINGILTSAKISGDIGLLSIDIDGNDYWVLDAIDAISPRILITEYNSTFGCDRGVSVPYREDFDRSRAHFSKLYWGASLPALSFLAERKGYSLVGSNTAGNNAFFVRDDVLGALPTLPAREAWRDSRFRESVGPGGVMSYLSDRQDRLRQIAHLPVVDVQSGETILVGELL
jgi:hypothetical protein